MDLFLFGQDCKSLNGTDCKSAPAGLFVFEIINDFFPGHFGQFLAESVSLFTHEIYSVKRFISCCSHLLIICHFVFFLCDDFASSLTKLWLERWLVGLWFREHSGCLHNALAIFK